MPKLQVPDVRCKVEGCWCVAVFRDVCGPIPSKLVISRYHVSWILKFSKPEGFFFFGFIILENFLFGKSAALLKPFLPGKAFVQESFCEAIDFMI